jgi:hypothetical protein
VTKPSRKVFSPTNVKYYSSEIIASLLALVLSVTSAVLMDKTTNSDALISVVSALGGTLGFLGGTLGVYALLHLCQYCRKERHLAHDMRSIFMANIHGIVGMYAFRIPCQYILQKLGLAPAFSAIIAQFLSGLIATVIRIHHNYKANIFGAFNPHESP